MRCRICNSKLVFYETASKIDYQSHSLNHAAFKTDKRDMDIYRCPMCTHLQTEYLLPDDFYDVYDEGKGASQYSGALDMGGGKIEKLKDYAASSDRYLDIGCGPGTALINAIPLFGNCLGVEPAGNMCQIAKNKNLNVINAYFDRALSLQDNFSAFSAFQVFEHIVDPYAILDYAYDILEDGGVGLINVPNGDMIFSHSLYHQLTFEHINYYTPLSMAYMAQRAGFEVIEVANIVETIELDLYIRKPMRHASFDATRRRLADRLHQLLRGYNQVLIWGAGAKSAKYATLLGEHFPVAHLVDSSEEKIGQYVAGVNMPVEMVTSDILAHTDAVVIFASSYNREIMRSLRTDFRYQGAIVYFEGDEAIIEG